VMFSITFNKRDVKCTNYIEDLQAAIEEEAKANSSPEATNFFDAYRSYDEIVTFMRDLQKNYSFLYVVPVGNSTEGRTIYGVEMNGGEGKKKRQGVMPSIYFQGGQHAREWIGPATVCYLLYNLAEGYGKNGTITRLVDEIKWHFVPVVNPDGYQYSRTNDRMWRKNRKRPPTGSTCYGVDTNRNWPAYWNRGGSSTNPCSEPYHGVSAGSEEEVKSVINYFSTMNNVVISTDWHSYGQYYLYPWGWSTTPAPGEAEFKRMGNLVVAAIRQIDNKVYSVGSGAGLLYVASGGFDDWAFATYQVNYSQTIELRDTGRYGFILPVSEIIPTGNENLNGVVVQALQILGN